MLRETCLSFGSEVQNVSYNLLVPAVWFQFKEIPPFQIQFFLFQNVTQSLKASCWPINPFHNIETLVLLTRPAHEPRTSHLIILVWYLGFFDYNSRCLWHTTYHGYQLLPNVLGKGQRLVIISDFLHLTMTVSCSQGIHCPQCLHLSSVPEILMWVP